MSRESLLVAAWRLNRTVPALIGFLLFLTLVALGVARLVIAPQLADLQATFLQQQEKYRQLRRNSDLIDTPQARYRQGESELETFLQAIPPSQDFPVMVSDLFEMAGQTGLDIANIGYDPKVLKDEPLLSYSLGFNVVGSYDQIKQFIFLIEHSARMIAIEELNLNTVQDQGTDKVALTLRLTTLFRMDGP